MKVSRSELKKVIKEIIREEKINEFHFTGKELSILKKDIVKFVRLEAKRLKMNVMDTYKFMMDTIDRQEVHSSLKAVRNEDLISGGKGDGVLPNEVDPSQFMVGTAVEYEHTEDSEKAQEIAIDHLVEDPKYYTKLIDAGLVDEKEALEKAKDLGVGGIYKLVKREEV